MAVTKKATGNPERSKVRRWIIRCKAGKFETYPLTHHNCMEVIRWCDVNHADCAPHILEGVKR